jgi:aminoglycoside/choline kinase family phosphotransferase
LYELATDVLIQLHGHAPMEGLPAHGLEQWLTELELFTEWYCPAVGANVDVAAYRDAWTQVLEPVRNWFDANIQPEHRREPWKQAA